LEENMNQPFSNKFMADEKNLPLMKELLWGPNGIRQAEELASFFTITPDAKILDLGCGMGVSSLYLAQAHGAQIIAADLFADPTVNNQFFQKLGIADKITPMTLDANLPLPFAKNYFDVIFSVGAYNMFGDYEDALPNLIPYVKKGGYIAVAFPGLKRDFNGNVPPEMQPFFDIPDVARYIRGIDWWSDLWKKAEGLEIITISGQACHDIAWREYLDSRNPDVAEEKWDLDMMAADGGNYYNTIQLVAKVV